MGINETIKVIKAALKSPDHTRNTYTNIVTSIIGQYEAGLKITKKQAACVDLYYTRNVQPFLKTEVKKKKSYKDPRFKDCKVVGTLILEPRVKTRLLDFSNELGLSVSGALSSIVSIYFNNEANND
jgi:hypothetical protein